MPSPVTRDRRQFKPASQPAPVEDDQPDAVAPPEEAAAPAPVAAAPVEEAPRDPNELSADPAQRAQQHLDRNQARFAQEQQAKNPFLYSGAIPNINQIADRHYRERVIAQGEQQYREQQIQQRAADVQRRREGIVQQKTRNAGLENKFRSTGQQFYTDPFGDIKPIIEASSGRPLFHATTWEEGTHPKTGEPVLQKRDQYGQRQFKTPPIVASPDLTDDQLYYKFGDNDLRPAGKIDDLVNHPNFDIARLAKRTASSRKKAMWKEAIDPLESVAANATVAHDIGQQKAMDLQDQIAKLNETSANIDPSVLEEKEGGIMGFGAKPTQRALQAQKQKSDIEGQIESLTGNLVKLNEDLKPSGTLGRAKRQSALDVAIFKAKALHDNYSDLADERRLILRQQGKSEADDPTLKSILAAQQEYGTQLERGIGASQREDTAHAPAAEAQPTPREQASSPVPPPDAPKDIKQQWANATPLERIKMMMGVQRGNTPIKEASPAIGSEAGGTKGGAFTIPEMKGEGVLPGVINAANKFTAGLTTPENVALMAGGSLASFIAKIAQGTKVALAAHAAETGANAAFTAQMAKDAVASGKDAYKVVQDPNATDKQKADAITSAILSSGMTAFAAKGAKEGAESTAAAAKQMARDKKTVKKEPTAAAKAAESKRAAAKTDPTAAAKAAVKNMEKDSRAIVAPDDSPGAAPKSAKESAEVLEPALKEKENTPPPAKSAEESASAMKEAEQRAADEKKAESGKEARIQSLADELSKGNDATRAAIIGRRKGLTTDQFLTALEGAADQRRGRIKSSEVADDVKSEADAVANSPINGETPGVENVGRIIPKELEHVADTISTEKAKKTAEAMANVGGDEAFRPDVPEEAPTLRELPKPEKAKESAQAIESQLGNEEALRRSPVGGEKLKEDLKRRQEEPPEEAPAIEQPAPKAPAPERVGKAAVRFSDGEIRTGDNHALIVDQIGAKDLRGSEDGFVTDSGRFVSREEAMKIARDSGQTKSDQSGLTAERLEYDRLQAKLNELGPSKFGTPEYQETWRQAEAIKNRNKGMPPGEVSGETAASEKEFITAENGESTRPGTVDAINKMRSKYGDQRLRDAYAEYEKSYGREPSKSQGANGSGFALFVRNAAMGDKQAVAALEGKLSNEQAKPVAVDENAAAPAKEAAVVQSSESAAKPAEKEAVTPESTYSAASKALEQAKLDYRAKKIGDKEFLAARKAFDDAKAALPENVEQEKRAEQERIANGTKRVGDTAAPKAGPTKEVLDRHIDTLEDRMAQDRTKGVTKNKAADTARLEKLKAQRAALEPREEAPSPAPAAPAGAVVKKTEEGPSVIPKPKVEAAVSKMADRHQLRAQKEFIVNTLKEASKVAPESLKLSEEGQADMAAYSDAKQPSVLHALAMKYDLGKDWKREDIPAAINAKHAEHMTINVPGDGQFRIPYSQGHLTRFAQRIETRFGKSTADLPAPTTIARESYKAKQPTAIPAVTKKPNADSLTKAVEMAVSDDPDRAILHRALDDDGFGVATNGRLLLMVAGAKGESGAAITAANKGKSYPQWRQAMPKWLKASKGKVRVDSEVPVQPIEIDTTDGLKAAIQASTIVGDKPYPSVVLHNLGDGKIGFSGKTDQGEFSTSGVNDGWITGMAAVAPDVLRDAMTAARLAGHDKVKLFVESETKPVVMVGGDNFASVIAPMKMGWDRPVGKEITSSPREASTESAHAETTNPETAPAPVSADVEKSTPATVEGDKIDRKWTAFDKDSGTLGIPREEMPQIKSENRGALVQFLKARGVEARAGMMDPSKLKPTQAEFSAEKVQAAREHTGSERPILVSADNHVIDGHHQWMAALDDKSGAPMPVIKLNAPVDRLLSEIKEFPSAQTAEGAKPASKAAEPTPEAAPRLSDRAIEALKKARISKPGTLYAHTPFTLAWDGAIDTAILAIRAGRGVHDAVTLAVNRFKDKFPDHTADDLSSLEQAVRDAHESKPEAAARVEMSGIRAQVSNFLKKGEIEKAMTYTRDAVDNHASVFGREESNSVKLDLQKAFDGKLGESSDALAFAVESGADRAKLDEMRAKLEASTKADPKWKQRALDAINFADKNLEALKPIVDRYNQITNEQMGREQFAGIDTLKRDNYVMHKQDIDESLGHMFLGAAGEGNSSFRKNRTHDTFADSIAAGVDPKSLNAVDLLQSRVTAGQQMANKRAWVESLKQFKDPVSKQPVAVDVTYTKRPDGSQYADAPNGYSVERVGNAEVAVMKGYEGIFSALTDGSWWNKSPVRRMIQQANATGKSLNLLFDTFHLGRLAAWNAATRLNAFGTLGGGVKAPNPFSHGEGVLTLDHSPQDLVRIAKEEGRSPEQIKQLLENKQKLNMALDTGANFGKISDALHEDVMHNLPVTGQFSKWLFDKYQRGAMSEIWLMEYNRQRAMGGNKTLSDQQVARNVSQEVNTRFGNLGRQGIFKSKTGQDIARLLLLAPQWNEGLVRSELGAGADAFKSAVNAATGKGLATSMLTRSLATMVIGQFVANQLLNQYTRGKYTWENPEEGVGAKLSAWIPDKIGGGPGFFLHPAGIGAEITHLLTSKYEKTADFRKSLVEAGRSRLSAIARPFATYLLGTDSLGRNIRPADIYKETAKEAVPLPIPTSSVVGAAKTLATGDRSENFPGQFQKQLMATGGLKTDQAPTPGSRMSSLATAFNKSKGIEPSGEFYAGDYTDLATALRVGNKANVETTLKDLLAKHSAADIAKYFSRQIGAPFTGNTKREPDFIKSLTQEQKDTYRQARRDRQKLREQANAAMRSYMAKNKVEGMAEALQAMMASPSNR